MQEVHGGRSENEGSFQVGHFLPNDTQTDVSDHIKILTSNQTNTFVVDQNSSTFEGEIPHNGEMKKENFQLLSDDFPPEYYPQNFYPQQKEEINQIEEFETNGADNSSSLQLLKGSIQPNCDGNTTNEITSLSQLYEPYDISKNQEEHNQ